MKALAITLVLMVALGPGTAGAQAVGMLDEVRRIGSAGAIDLALDRIEQGQPKQQDLPAWADWEVLRLELLAAKGRDAEVLGRMKGYSDPPVPGRTSVALLMLAARSALRVGEPASARRFLARIFLNAELNANEYRGARLSAIEAYLAEGDAEAAYRSMLRFQQDFTPLRSEEAERFVAGLIEADRPNEAANWLTRLEVNSPWSAVLRMRAGLLSPETAIAQARAAIAKGGGSPAWALLAAAGRAQSNRAIAIEVSEQRLNGATLPPARPDRSDHVSALWRLYAEVAQHAANQAHLLSGDDAAWLNQATRTLKTQPQIARSLLGHLARNAGSSQMRTEAQLHMIASLRDAKLTRAALRLFADAQPFPVEALDPRVRLDLGTAAIESAQPGVAIRYWQNLATPSGMSAPQWQVRYCSALVQAGKGEEALAVARSLLASKPPPAPDVLRRLIDVALQALASMQPRTAQVMSTMLLPLVADADRGAVLVALARSHEANADHRSAAAAFLQAAVSAAAPDSDRDALRAREAAAANLLKAGLRSDARSVYEWLARNAKDAGIRESAARALKGLN